MRRAERRRPWRVRRQRHQRAVTVTDVRMALPPVLACGIERVVHEAVRAGLDAVEPIVGRTIDTDLGAEGTAGHLERSDQAGEQRTRPGRFVAAPSVVHAFAQHDACLLYTS